VQLVISSPVIGFFQVDHKPAMTIWLSSAIAIA
jgi:hypothetical protein